MCSSIVSDDPPREPGFGRNTVWGLVIVGLLGGATGGGAGVSIFGRPDPHTGSDAKALKLEILAELARVEREASWARHEIENGIRGDMPPRKTRQRIESLEAHLRESAGYRPPTYGWDGRILE